MSNPYIGEIRLFAGNYAPYGWLLCQGQSVAIATYETLYNLIGTTYGGDGVTTFNLPNMSSRVPVHQGQMPGGPVWVLGQAGGSEQVTLTANQVGGHTHALACTAAAGKSASPQRNFLAAAGTALYTTGSVGGAMAAASIPATGGGNQPHENRSPYLALNFIIAWEGIYPQPN